MNTITLEELLEAGCHFGHQTTRHNPKSRDYIFEARDNIHIIDLGKTKEGLDNAAVYLRDLAKKNGNIIVVGTKRQAQPIIETEVKRAVDTLKAKGIIDPGLFYITKRWIGGILTNFTELEKNIKKLKDLELRLNDETEKAKYTKKEIGLWAREKQKLESYYNGILNMKKNPEALIIVDTHTEHLAVREARQTHVKTIGIVDTNSDPTIIDYPIPANDDAVGSIQIIVAHLIDAWIEGKGSEGTKGTEETKEKKKAKKEVK